MTESKSEKVAFTFSDFGPKVKPPNWSLRVEKLNRYYYYFYYLSSSSSSSSSLLLLLDS